MVQKVPVSAFGCGICSFGHTNTYFPAFIPLENTPDFTKVIVFYTNDVP